MDHFDVVAVGIEEEPGVVARMIFPLARRSVVPASRRQSSAPSLVDHLAIAGLKGQMHMGALFARVDPELVGREMLVVAHDWYADNTEDGRVKALAGLQVPGSKVDVIDQTAAMKLHGARSSGIQRPTG
jgi:hypothetical protein